MLSDIRALLVVLATSGLIWWLARPICLKFMSEADYLRRRNIWAVLTVAAFISPSIWLYVALAAPLMFWGARKDENPVGFSLAFMHVIPPLLVDIPTIVINQLFPLNNYRLIAFVVLLPYFFVLRRERSKLKENEFLSADLCVVGFLSLQIILLLPYESITHSIRRSVLAFIDFGLLYYTASRGAASRPRVANALVSFGLGVAAMAPVAVFESVAGYFTYGRISVNWGGGGLGYMLMRGDTLRAQVAAGHPLALGYIFSMALAVGLLLRAFVGSTLLRALPVMACVVGLLAALSRGPWLVGGLVYLVFYLLAPVKPSSVMNRLALIALGAAALLASPYGSKVIDYLPFVGTVDSDTVDYRQRLAAVAWLLIQQSPVFGSPFVLQYMESLRQGEGIIDLVNAYATVTMYYGFVGLGLFMGAYLIGLSLTIRQCMQMRRTGNADGAVGAALAACMIGTLLMLAIGSLGTSLAYLYWTFTGLAIAFARGRAGEPVSADAEPVPVVVMPTPRGRARRRPAMRPDPATGR